MDSVEFRERLVHALNLDLIGPGAGHDLASERLPGWVRPLNWYLTGFLIRAGAPPEQSADSGGLSIHGEVRPIHTAGGVGPGLIIAGECLHGEGAPHCQDTTPVFDMIARAETTRDRIGGFGRASAASEWLVRHAAPIACRSV